MAAGRKPQPTHLRVVKGNRGKRPLPAAEPEASAEQPQAPSWLPPRARELFDQVGGRLEEVGLLSATHTEMLALLAQRLLEVELHTAVLAKKGHTYMNRRTGVCRKRPEVAMLAEAARHAQSLLAEFGLSPAASGKVSLSGGRKKKSPYSELPS